VHRPGVCHGHPGFGYAYFDASKPGLAASPHLMTDDAGCLRATLGPILQPVGDTTGFLLYNDASPADVHMTDDSKLGHTKGVLAFDTATKIGLWPIRSSPEESRGEASGGTDECGRRGLEFGGGGEHGTPPLGGCSCGRIAPAGMGGRRQRPGADRVPPYPPRCIGLVVGSADGNEPHCPPGEPSAAAPTGSDRWFLAIHGGHRRPVR